MFLFVTLYPIKHFLRQGIQFMTGQFVKRCHKMISSYVEFLYRIIELLSAQCRKSAAAPPQRLAWPNVCIVCSRGG